MKQSNSIALGDIIRREGICVFQCLNGFPVLVGICTYFLVALKGVSLARLFNCESYDRDGDKVEFM